MAEQTIQQLQSASDVVKNETTQKANTANRIGSLFRNIVDTFAAKIISSTDDIPNTAALSNIGTAANATQSEINAAIDAKMVSSSITEVALTWTYDEIAAGTAKTLSIGSFASQSSLGIAFAGTANASEGSLEFRNNNDELIAVLNSINGNLSASLSAFGSSEDINVVPNYIGYNPIEEGTSLTLYFYMIYKGTSVITQLAPVTNFQAIRQTQLATPVISAVNAISSTELQVVWGAITGADNYKLEISTDGLTGWTQVGGIIAATSYNPTGLTAGTTYYTRVSADVVDQNGAYYLSEVSSVVSGQTATNNMSFVSATTSSDGNNIDITLSSNVTSISSGITLIVNSNNISFAYSINSGKIRLTPAFSIVSGDIITVTANNSDAVSTNGETLTDFTNQPVTNLVGVDSDAQTIITNLSITSSNDQYYTNYLVSTLKSLGLWDKIYALWPYYGTTLNTQKFNWKNPIDNDAAFRLVAENYSASNHDANGYKPNGTNQALRTKFIPSVELTSEAITDFTLISGTSTYKDFCCEMGAYNNNDDMCRIFRFDDTSNYTGIFTHSGARSTLLNGRIGLKVIAKNAYLWQYNNGSITNVDTSPTNSNLTDQEITIGAQNNGTLAYFSDQQFYFSALAKYLTPREVFDLTEVINTFCKGIGHYGVTESNKMLIVGNSISYGVGSSGVANRYSTKLCTDLGYQEKNISLSGRELCEFTGASGSLFAQMSQLIPKKSQGYTKMLIPLGTNDYLRGPDNIGDLIDTQLPQILSYAITQGWLYSDIVMSGAFYGKGEYNARPSKKATINNHISAICENVGAKFIDIWQYQNDNGGDSGFDTDAIHPNDAGHNTIYLGYKNNW